MVGVVLERERDLAVERLGRPVGLVRIAAVVRLPIAMPGNRL